MMTPDVNVVVIDFKTCKGKEMVVPNEEHQYLYGDDSPYKILSILKTWR